MALGTLKPRTLDTLSVLKLKQILYTTDLSLAAEKALPYALEFARRYRAKLHVVHVIQPDVFPFSPLTAWPKMAEEEEVFRQESKAELEERLQDVPHEISFRRGNVTQVLLEMVEQKEIDLLVLSTYGRSGVQKALVGSVAEYMFRHAACPVLTVGPAVVAKSRDAGEFNRILYATDFSPESLTAAPYAISLAREHHAQLILMHCIGRDEDVEGMHRALANLDPLAADLIAEPDCIVERGRPVEKILEVAEGHAADLIVLGIRPANGKRFELEQFLHPGVLRIVSQATCPVLTVRG